MSRKLTAATIMVLAFGGIMIPAAPFINNLIQDLTYGSVDEGLLGIKDQGIPIVIESLHQIGPASALSIIKEQGAAGNDLVAKTSLLMGNLWIQCVLTTMPINPSLYLLFDVEETNALGLGIMNHSAVATFGGYPAIQGIPEWFGGDLNFSDAIGTGDSTGLFNLLYGVNTSGWWGDRLPGFFEDTYRRVGDDEWPPESLTQTRILVNRFIDRGFGIGEIINLIESANDIEMEVLCGENGYNLTSPDDLFEYNGEFYTKLEIFYYYFTKYFSTEAIELTMEGEGGFNDPFGVVPALFPVYAPNDWNGYHTDFEDILTYSIIEQWAKCNNFDEGSDLYDSEPKIPEGTYGLEPAGPGVDSDIPMQAALQL